MNKLLKIVLPAMIVVALSGCETLTNVNPDSETESACKPFKKDKQRHLTITADKDDEISARPKDLHIKAGGIITINFVGKLEDANNIQIVWNGLEPATGKDGSWLRKGNPKGRPNAVLFVPCDAGPEADSGVDALEYKYDIYIGPDKVLDPRIYVKPPN